MPTGRLQIDVLIDATRRMRTENEPLFLEVYWNQQRLLRTLKRADSLMRRLCLRVYDPDSDT